MACRAYRSPLFPTTYARNRRRRRADDALEAEASASDDAASSPASAPRRIVVGDAGGTIELRSAGAAVGWEAVAALAPGRTLVVDAGEVESRSTDRAMSCRISIGSSAVVSYHISIGSRAVVSCFDRIERCRVVM